MKLRPYSRRVYYYETDKMGIVHHSNYIRWFEEARVDLIEQAGLPFETVEAQGLMTPVLSAESTYKLPFKFGEARFSVTYEVYDPDGVLHAVGKTTHCFVDMDMRPVRIKKTHPHVYEVYDEICRSTEELYDE